MQILTRKKIVEPASPSQREDERTTSSNDEVRSQHFGYLLRIDEALPLLNGGL